MNNDWSTVVEWNASLEAREEREAVARDYLWASELGKSPIDVFLRMRGIKETNPPNGRSRRKFEAGNYMEWLVSLVYARAGLLREQQTRVEHQYDGLLKVTGKLDFLVGGQLDFSQWERMESLMRELNMPEFIFRAGQTIRDSLQEKYPNGLLEKLVEIKSCSAMMFDAMEKKGWKGQAGHRMQNFHYLKGTERQHGGIIYIEKDSLRMAEVPIENPSAIEEEYRAAIEKFTGYYDFARELDNKEFIEERNDGSFAYHWSEGLPRAEEFVTFSNDLGKFSKNFNVEYSGYLTPLYGFAQPADYDEAFKPLIARWNRVLGRRKRQEKMTVKNLEVLEEIKQHGFDIDSIVANFAESEDETSEE